MSLYNLSLNIFSKYDVDLRFSLLVKTNITDNDVVHLARLKVA